MIEEELLEKDFCYDLVGLAMKVINKLGHGYRERTYENAFCIELKKNNIPFSQQSHFPIYYDNQIIDEFVPDMIADKRVILEFKTVESITDEHKGQLLNYLRVTGIKVGIIINFKHPTLQWEHIVLDKAR